MDNAYFKEEKVSILTKIKRFLFPSYHCYPPKTDEFRIVDEIHNTTVVKLSIVSRIRLIVSGSLTVKNTIVTEKEVGKIKTSSVSFVNPPFTKS